MLNLYDASKFAQTRQAEILEYARQERLARSATRLRRKQIGADLDPNWAQALGNWMIAFGQWLRTRQKPIL
jgi:hypothetical protein